MDDILLGKRHLDEKARRKSPVLRKTSVAEAKIEVIASADKEYIKIMEGPEAAKALEPKPEPVWQQRRISPVPMRSSPTPKRASPTPHRPSPAKISAPIS